MNEVPLPNVVDRGYLNMELSWTFTRDIEVPYICSVEGKRLGVCIRNDYPVYKDYRFSLVADQRRVAVFNKWPKCWKKPRESWLLPLYRMGVAAQHIWWSIRRKGFDTAELK